MGILHHKVHATVYVVAYVILPHVNLRWHHYDVNTNTNVTDDRQTDATLQHKRARLKTDNLSSKRVNRWVLSFALKRIQAVSFTNCSVRMGRPMAPNFVSCPWNSQQFSQCWTSRKLALLGLNVNDLCSRISQKSCPCISKCHHQMSVFQFEKRQKVSLAAGFSLDPLEELEHSPRLLSSIRGQGVKGRWKGSPQKGRPGSATARSFLSQSVTFGGYTATVLNFMKYSGIVSIRLNISWKPIHCPVVASSWFLPRDALYCKARYCDRMSSVRPSVTLVNCDHIGWNSSKIISPLVSMGRSLFATPNMTGLLQGDHP